MKASTILQLVRTFSLKNFRVLKSNFKKYITSFFGGKVSVGSGIVSDGSKGIIVEILVVGSKLLFFILEVKDFPENENFFFVGASFSGGFEQ